MSEYEKTKTALETARGSRKKYLLARRIVFMLVMAGACVGLATNSGTGTPSAWGWDLFSSICPVGALETALAGHQLIPRLLIGAAATVVLIVLFGKAFCSWACPVPRLHNLFSSRKQMQAEQEDCEQAASSATKRWEQKASIPKRPAFDSRHIVLGGALASSLVFGFPVFCLICPVGLTFGELILFWRLVQYNQWTWALVIFPVIVILEVVVLKKWCGRICPIGALLSLIARENKTFHPQVDETLCLKSTGSKACDSCARACPEHIDISTNLGDADERECIKCGHCVEACPMAAIKFTILKK